MALFGFFFSFLLSDLVFKVFEGRRKRSILFSCTVDDKIAKEEFNNERESSNPSKKSHEKKDTHKRAM